MRSAVLDADEFHMLGYGGSIPPSAILYTGCSSVRSECLTWDQDVAGSTPAAPIDK